MSLDFSFRSVARAAFIACAALSGIGLSISPVRAQATQPEPEVQQLVVTATRFPTALSQLPADVQVITAAQIAESGATTVNDALMRILGIPGRLDLNGGGDYSLDLRGFGERADNNQVIVVDGLRLSEPDMGGTRLAGIPIETVIRIEVLRGSSAVLYGEGATAGAIVITTSSFGPTGLDSQPSFKGAVQVGRGNLSSNDASANVRWSQGAFSVSSAVKNSATDNHRPNAFSKADSGELTLAWREADWSVGVKHVTDGSDARLPGALDYATFLTDPFSTQGKYLDNYAKIDSTRTQLHATAKLADWSLSAEFGTRDKVLESLTTFGNTASRFDSDIHARDLNLKATTPWQIGGSGQQTSFGMDKRAWDRTTTYGDSTSESTGWFVRHEASMGPDTRVIAGFRMDEVQRTSSGTEDLSAKLKVWDLGFSQRFSKSWTGWSRLGSSYRVPTVDELSYSYTGDPNLKPQTSLDQEAGVRWRSDGYRADLRVYRNVLSDEIAFDSINFKNVNLDPTQRQGVEADLSIPVSGDWHVQPHFAWRQAQFKRGSLKGKSIPLVAPQAVGVRALGYLGGGHQVSGGMNLVGSQYVDNDNTCKIPSHTTLDARYAYTWRELEASVGIANLLDKRYFTTAYNCVGALPKDVYPELGRALSVRLKVAF